MPGPTKRTRSDENDSTPTTPTPTTPSTRSTSVTRRTPHPPPPTNTTTTPGPSPPRPILTRSAATQPPTSSNSNGVTRSTSLFSISTRRTNFSSASSTASSTSSSGFNIGLGLPGPGPSSSSRSSGLASGSGPARGGTLVRTQSTPSLASPTQLKAAVAAGGGGAGRGKGGDDDEIGSPGPRRFGKGKENIPPKKDEDVAEGSARKRPRVNSRASMSGRSRGRSNSIVSVRSETSGRHSSLAPSSSCSSIASWHTRLPSPSPSQSSFTTPSIDTATSADPLDLLKDDKEDYFDVDRTPTKKRPITRATAALPTPPPSSPSLTVADLEGATRRVSLVRLHSTLSDKTEVDEDADVVMIEADGVKPKLNAYKQLKSLLRLSSTVTGENASVDQTIIGREEEKDCLRKYLDGVSDKDVGMYVSGPPGTGKTALVTALGRQLALSGWKVVEFGCMGLKVTDIWRRLGEELECGKTEKDVKECVESTKVLIILDEIDSLMPPPPSIAPPATSHLLTRLFSLPLSSPTTKLVAISNTLDLTLRARLVLPDNLQPQVLPFKAYNAVDMASIVNARVVAAAVEDVKVDTKAVELLTRKVEAQNGDLRMCLGVLSSAISLAEGEWIKKTGNAIPGAVDDKAAVPMIKVSLPHILKAFTSHAQQLRAAAGSNAGNQASSTGKKIRSVPLQGKMVLVSILIFLSRSKAGLNGCPAIGSGSITPPPTPSKNTSSTNGGVNGDSNITSLYTTYSHILSHTSSPFPPAAESDYRDLLSNLETLGLVSLGSSNTTMSRSKSNSLFAGGGKVDLCVKEEEVYDGLGLVDGATKGVAEEEVKRVWEREESKVRRVREKQQNQLLQAQQDREDF